MAVGAEEHSRKRSGKASKKTRLEAGVRSRAGERKRRGAGAQGLRPGRWQRRRREGPIYSEGKADGLVDGGAVV